jgi:hypothetical protein
MVQRIVPALKNLHSFLVGNGLTKTRDTQKHFYAVFRAYAKRIRATCLGALVYLLGKLYFLPEQWLARVALSHILVTDGLAKPRGTYK